MKSPDVPYRTQPKVPVGHGHQHGHHEHLSGWPLLLGLVAALPFIGLATHPVLFVVGFLLLGIGVIGWIREDYLEFPKGPNPLTLHTQGRKDTGWWGIVLFLATEVVLFGSLFAVYFHSMNSSDLGWPPIGTPGHMPPLLFSPAFWIITVNTLILVSSGFVLMYGEKGLYTGDRKRFLTGVSGAILLGAVFIAVQAYEYMSLIGEGFVLGANIYTGIFYGLTGTHGIHVTGGLLFLTIILVRAARGQFDRERHTAVTAAAYYWHFVDVVWILLYLVVYLVPALLAYLGG